MSPDKTPLGGGEAPKKDRDELLKMIPGRLDLAECVLAYRREVAALEAVVVRLQQERDELFVEVGQVRQQLDAADATIEHWESVVVRLREALQQARDYVHDNCMGQVAVNEAVRMMDAALVVSPDKPPEPHVGPVSILPDDVTDEEAETFLDAIADKPPEPTSAQRFMHVLEEELDPGSSFLVGGEQE